MATSKHARWGWAFAGMLALAPPASAQLFGGAELQRRAQALEQQDQVFQQRLDALEARLGQIETALQKNQQVLDLLQEVDGLRNEIAQLRGQAEVQRHDLDTLGKRQNDLYADLDQRLADLSRAAPVAAAPVTSAADAEAETQRYEAALKLFREKDYAGAATGFREFLQAHPDSTLAANAQYWLGYSHYVRKDYKTALATQQTLVATYPSNPKVPDALLNIAANQIAMDQLDAARKTLKELVARHPGTEAAKLAERRLSALK